jgi:hypothetical protein
MGRFLPYEQPDSDGGRSRAAERNPGRKRFWPALDFSRWKTLPSWSAVGAMCAVYRRRKGFSRTGPGNAKEQRGMRRFRLRGFGKSKHRVHAGRYLLQPDPAPGHPPARAEKRNSKPANRSRSHALSLARLSFPTPARGTCGPECKGCPGTFCKGCHGTGQLKGRSSSAVPGPLRQPQGRFCRGRSSTTRRGFASFFRRSEGVLFQAIYEITSSLDSLIFVNGPREAHDQGG